MLEKVLWIIGRIWPPVAARGRLWPHMGAYGPYSRIWPSMAACEDVDLDEIIH